MRCTLMLLLAVAPCGLAAQATSPLAGSFNTDNFRIIRVDVDHGPASQPVTIDVTLDCVTGPGWLFELIDWDGYVQGLTLVSQTRQVMPGGSNSAQLTTAPRAGIHPFVLRLTEVTQLGQQSDYTGSVSVNAGAIAAISESDRLFNTSADPLRQLEGGLQAIFISWSGPGAWNDTGVLLDLGPTPQAPVLRFDCSAMGVQRIRIGYPDGAGGRAQIVLNADSDGDIPLFPGDPGTAISLPALSGQQWVTVDIDHAQNFSYSDWTLSVPGGVTLTSMHGPGICGAGDAPEPRGCATGAVPPAWAVPGLLLLALCLCGRRRRAA